MYNDYVGISVVLRTCVVVVITAIVIGVVPVDDCVGVDAVVVVSWCVCDVAVGGVIVIVVVTVVVLGCVVVGYVDCFIVASNIAVTVDIYDVVGVGCHQCVIVDFCFFFVF